LPAESERQGLIELLRALSARLNSGEPVDEELALLERRCLELLSDLELFAPEAERPQGARDERSPAPRENSLVSQRSSGPALPELVRWAESRGGNVALHASPLDIAKLLQDRLYDRTGPIVFTSATLAVAGSLDYFARAVGLTDGAGPLYPTDQLQLASPFDYERRAALYLPRSIPDPIDPGFPGAVADELRRLLPITGGRAFALFTSLRNMRAVHGLLESELVASGLQVLLQGEASKPQLLRAFKERPSVLFASQSFWEGVDVQGDALSLVVIDKLPFASPGEPLTAARIERIRALGGEPFSSWQVPQAALALKQGFGRLIRSAQDRGVVALLDARLTSKSYGRTFLATLPKCRILRSAEEVAEFWKG
jgi:ATP-dependent DNA helicase DinG